MCRPIWSARAPCTIGMIAPPTMAATSMPGPLPVSLPNWRDMQTRDFKSGNFVITGNPRINPGTSFFDSSLNFQFDLDLYVIHNLKPLIAAFGFRRCTREVASTMSLADHALITKH